MSQLESYGEGNQAFEGITIPFKSGFSRLIEAKVSAFPCLLTPPQWREKSGREQGLFFSNRVTSWLDLWHQLFYLIILKFG